jgi:hypothetical protein
MSGSHEPEVPVGTLAVAISPSAGKRHPSRPNCMIVRASLIGRSPTRPARIRAAVTKSLCPTGEVSVQLAIVPDASEEDYEDEKGDPSTQASTDDACAQASLGAGSR